MFEVVTFTSEHSGTQVTYWTWKTHPMKPSLFISWPDNSAKGKDRHGNMPVQDY